ncbi:hypothetical protein [Cytophaga hutchinsonii]|uniref:Uncharacterized protein n=1 Tax=Cytophaga hutchinsonii (strain ATCC 33406 / DSM 1761 / CIP 103989 / NBRC 15051 / NCIMB 9469 / D465) TaxID=269798 RepID=A0A6N4SMM6_CYTH3|nr:hypothetical protein [Cytophaga hutchinsonii]ABG57505.1 hypothetical protein CHU_0213 [Cytophaga hutchinsonii ATCC 33406]SFW98782.1 hypothetical protein SAMN04487930_10165 [Cytophaga hutchinsonii ATCC 33406]
MTPLTVFEICAAISVATFLLPYLIFGDGIILLIIIFPAMAAEKITGERGLDLGRKSYVYLFFLYLFVLTEVLILATILFGAYCLFWGYPSTSETAATAVVSTPQPNEISSLILINKLLLLVISYFTCMFIYNSIKYREAYRQLKRTDFMLFQFVPLVTIPLGYIYLLGCLHYLTHFPTNEKIGPLPTIAGYLYVAYLLYNLAKLLFFYAKRLRTGFADHKLSQSLRTLVTLVYDITFLYFFYQLYSVLKM